MSNEKAVREPFIKSDQYHFIKLQTRQLVSGHQTVNDKGVREALKSLAAEKVLARFEELSEERSRLLEKVASVTNQEEETAYLDELFQYVIPFQKVAEQDLKKLFSKVKKLKMPKREQDFREITYLCWDDEGSDKRYIVAFFEDRLIGLQGTFKPMNQKGICVLCNRNEEIGMFLTEKKGASAGTFTKKGNTICKDSKQCNQHITDAAKLANFLQTLKK